MAPSPKSTAALGSLHDSIASIFDQTQISLANHKKNCVALYKLHTQAGAIPQSMQNGTVVKLVGERAFSDVFIDMVNRVVVVKKGIAAADRIVKFIGSYVRYTNEKASERKAKVHLASSTSASSRPSDEDDEETLASRFVSRLLKWLLQGFMARNKTVRFRTVYIVSEMIPHLGEIDEDIYVDLRGNLIQRAFDKELFVRSHAVIALSKLVGSEDPAEIQKGEKSILEIMLDVLCFDSAAEVRRAALVHVPLTPSTLDVVLTRTRDVDPVIRKLVYSSRLQELEHPRQLTIAQREDVVKDGLGDREPAVRLAAAKMVSTWFDVALGDARSREEGDSWVGDDGYVMKGFVEFLKIFDVIGPGKGVAVDAVMSMFITRPDLLQCFIFTDDYWTNMSSESAVLARIFMEHCLNTQNERLLESASMPVVTAVAFHIQGAYNELLGLMQETEEAILLRSGEVDQEEEEEKAQREEDIAVQEIVLGEMLAIAGKLDYADEIGRRKTFAVVKDMLIHEQLPESLIEPCLDVLAEISPTERELIRVVVEVVIELRDEDGRQESENGFDRTRIDDSQSDISQTPIRKIQERSMRRRKQREELTAEERVRVDTVDMRCLNICIGMLERVNESFEDNSTLEGILSDLIIPAVKRKELAMRERGLASLGLSCLIAKNMALNSFQLFLSQIQTAPDDIKLKVLQVVFDLIVLYPEFLGRSDDIAERIITFLLQTLETEESHVVQAVLCIGISKLLLSGVVNDPRVLTSLVLTYVSPATSNNLELRQCLSYFFPVYCYSSSSNQSRMQSIFVTAYDFMTRIYEELDENQGMINPYQFGLLLIDWTNPEKLANSHKGLLIRNVHLDLAIAILVALYDSDRQPEDQKFLCQFLLQLQISPEAETRSLLKLNILLSHLDKQCPFDNPALDKLMRQFKTRFSKSFSAQLEHINPSEYVDNEFRQMYEFIGVEMSDEFASPGLPHNVQQSRQNAPVSRTAGAQLNSISEAVWVTGTSEEPRPAEQRRGSEEVLSLVSVHSGLEETKDLPSSQTPQRKPVKRLRTPGSRPSIISPFNKKRRQAKSPRPIAEDVEKSRSGDETSGSGSRSSPTPRSKKVVPVMIKQSAVNFDSDVNS